MDIERFNDRMRLGNIRELCLECNARLSYDLTIK